MSAGTEGGFAVVFESERPAACSDRALVLTSLDIPHEVLRSETGWQLVVPGEFAERAQFELWQYDQENRPQRRQKPLVTPRQHDGVSGVLVYVGLIGLFAWLAGEAAFGRDWLAAGRMDGREFRDGEIWRTFTALTLHLDVKHLIGNMGFGSLFGFFAGRLLGSGAAWCTIVVAAAVANGLNAMLLDVAHRSIGASTAVFAALGLVSGYVWRGRLMSQERWPYRLGPIVGGIALLAYTGTGGENTDIGAHLMGFVCGLAAGGFLVGVTPLLGSARLQSIAGGTALALIIGSWMLALL
ncbi:MAG: rhomboid family intramembrane serine protease [Woeseiaceae bacterium]|nr:rhomboid family intramembrane serine protease [Woeseiaceae bacterium]